MRKVLLATTALVAMSVTAAQADVSVSGSMDFQYTTQDNADDEAGVDGNIKIVGTVTTDTGLTVTVTQNNTLQTTDGVEDAFMTLAGDFGTVILGETDMVNDRNDGALGKNNDVFTLASAEAGSMIGTDTTDSTSANIGFESPTMNGMKVYAGAVPNGGSQLGANFALGGISMMVQTASGFTAGLDETAVAAKMGMGAMTVAVGKKQEDLSGTKTDSMDVTLKYAVNDTMTVSFMVEEGKSGSTKHENQALEVAYSIAPGLTAYVGTNSVDTAGTTNSGAAAALSVSF